MAKKRTKADKKYAMARRLERPTQVVNEQHPSDAPSLSAGLSNNPLAHARDKKPSTISSGAIGSTMIRAGRSTSSFSLLQSQVRLVYQDLYKTLFVTAIVLSLLVGIYWYLIYNG
jgi:hypothetical protein